MSSTSINIQVLNGVGYGNAVDVSGLVNPLTFTLAGTFVGELKLQSSNDGTIFTTFATISVSDPVKVLNYDVKFVRSYVKTYVSGTATIALSAERLTVSLSATNINLQVGIAGLPMVVDGSGVVQPVSAAALPLPSGAASNSTLSTRLADATFTDRINTLGQKAMGYSTPVVIASDQTAIPITGSITASNPSVGTDGAAAPASGTQIAGTDGTNLQAVQVFDADTGGGTQYVLGVALRKAASGGSVEAGTNADPLRIDPTGATIQPVSAAALPLPTGAATESTLSALNAKVPSSPAQEHTAAATPSSARLSDGSAFYKATTPADTQPISAATLPLPSGAATSALQTQPGVDIGDVTINNTSGGAAVNIQDGGNSITVDAASLPLPTGAATEATLTSILADATFTGRINTFGQKTMANSTPVVISSDQSAIAITGSITASNPSVGADGAAVPASSTQIGGTDGTNLQSATMFDVDTGGGAQYVLGVGLRKAASGGSVEAGTSSDPIRTDPTGTTAQPVTDNAGSLTVDSPQLPGALVGGRLDENVGAWLGSTAPTVGSKTSANSVPVVIASDQAVIPISDNAGSLTVDGTITANIGTAGTLALDASVTAQSIVDNAPFTDGTTRVAPAGYIFDEVAGTALTENDAAAARIDSKRAIVNVIEDTTTRGQRLTITASNAAKVDGSAVTQPTSATQLPAALVGGRLDENVGAWLGSTAPTVGSKTSANSVPVVLASDQAQLPAALVGGRLDVNVGAALPAGTNRIGRFEYNVPTTGQLTSTSISVAASGDNTLIVGVGGQTIRVWRILLVFNAAVNIVFKDGASTSLTGTMNMNANSSIVLDFDGEPWFLTSTANAFILNLSGAIQTSGRVWYTQS